MATCHKLVLPGVIWIACILVVWINPPIADDYTRDKKIDVDKRMFQVVGHRGYKVTCVAFTGQVDFPLFKFGVLVHEISHELVQVPRNLFQVDARVKNAATEAETCTYWLVQEQNVGIVVPRKLVVSKVTSVFNAIRVVLEVVRPDFGPRSDLARASGSSLKPNY